MSTYMKLANGLFLESGDQLTKNYLHPTSFLKTGQKSKRVSIKNLVKIMFSM